MKKTIKQKMRSSPHETGMLLKRCKLEFQHKVLKEEPQLILPACTQSAIKNKKTWSLSIRELSTRCKFFFNNNHVRRKNFFDKINAYYECFLLEIWTRCFECSMNEWP